MAFNRQRWYTRPGTEEVKLTTKPEPRLLLPSLALAPTTDWSSHRPSICFDGSKVTQGIAQTTRIMPSPYWTTGCIYGATGVLLGAFGAHGLKNRVSDPAKLASWSTAAHYQVSSRYHSFPSYETPLMRFDRYSTPSCYWWPNKPPQRMSGPRDFLPLE